MTRHGGCTGPAGMPSAPVGYPGAPTTHSDRGRMSNKSKAGLTAIRIPLLILVALLVMLAIGVLIYTSA